MTALPAHASGRPIGAGAVLQVLDGGLLTTVQDAGRPDWAHLGVPESGAADRWSLAVANLLLGNDPGDAALEMTLTGPVLVARSAVTIALAGADLRARIRGGRRLAPGRSHRLAAGDIVEIPGDDAATPATGGRGYLAVPGGVDVPIVLGSRSTCLAAGFGGSAGQAVRTGDTITAGRVERGGAAADGPAGLVWPGSDADDVAQADAPSGTLRVLPVRDVRLGTAGVGNTGQGTTVLGALVDRDWRVGSAADRVGVRLVGEALPDGVGGEITTHGVPWGAIQVPPDGMPILLGPDHQTTGGYRVAGVVISADLPRLGQLRPGAPVRLLATDRATALAALRAQRDALAAGATVLREAAGWNALIDAAGG
jgi:5-oxoprolinase (ATP-hydrolysing) subunit C